jgi:hypothetical protein
MARQGRPWAIVVTIAVCALLAAGALATSATLRSRGVATTVTDTTTTSPGTSGAGVDGCLVSPCTVLGKAQVGDTAVDLVADHGDRGGRMRIGGAGASKVVEVTITSMGAVLGPDSLQCVVDTLSACLIRGGSDSGVIGQVVAGRSASWSELAQPFVSDAGYLALAQVTPDPGPEILVAQHDCQRGQDCSSTRVYVRVYNLRSQELGCTGYYQRLESLPGWPSVTLKRTDLKDCV